MSKTVYVAMSSDIVFDRPLNAARRRCRYGYQAMMARHLKWGLRPRPAHEGFVAVCSGCENCRILKET